MLYTFEPRFVLTDKKMFMQHYSTELYNFERTRIVNTMKCDLKYFSFTTDGWTSHATLLTLSTILMTSGIFRVTSYTAEMTMDHTAMNLANELQDSPTDKTDNQL